MRKSIHLALITGIISGIAVFLNGFYVTKIVKNPFVLTSSRNFLVALLILVILIITKKWSGLKNLNYKDWGKLVLIGLIGGSIPFLLFFKGLSMTAFSSTGAFLHKTLFLWVAVLAIPFLKEKISTWQILGLSFLSIGIFLIDSPKFSFKTPEILILIAILFWTFETILVKKFLKTINFYLLAFSRMFFGSFIMMIFLGLTNQFGLIFKLNQIQLSWILLTSILLLGYVLTWYGALKYGSTITVTSILTIGFPITVLLQNLVSGKYQLDKIYGIGFVLAGILTYIGLYKIYQEFINIKKIVSDKNFLVRKSS